MNFTSTAASHSAPRLAVQRQKNAAGMSLIELMIAMSILAVTLGGLSVLFIFASETNHKNSRATSSTMLAQQVLEQISAQHPDSLQVITIADCAGNQWAVNTVGNVGPAGTGAQLVTAATSPYYGGLDPAQDYANVPAGYGMQYVDCAGGGRQTTYDVRWNIVTLNQYTRLITVSARQNSSANQLGGRIFALPSTLRGIGGM